MAQVKVGMVMVSNGKNRPQPMRLHLTTDTLILQKEEIAQTGDSNQAEPPQDTRDRVVKITRQKVGGLGLSIKGGAEHKLPVLISRIFKGQAADQSGELFVGDAIIMVNKLSLDDCSHDEAVNVLRSAGDTVTLTVRHYKAVSPFLSKMQRHRDRMSVSGNANAQEPVTIMDGGNVIRGVLKPTSSLDGNPPPSPGGRRWTDVMTIPLVLAYLTRYMMDTDKLRPNAFEIHAQDGKPSAVIHCDDTGMLSEWIKHISNNILQLTNQQIKLLNRSLSVSDQVFHMGWLSEGCSAPQPWYKWKPRFISIKGSDLYFFESPPKVIQDYSKCTCVYRVFQCMFSILKESDLADERHHCFCLRTGPNESRYLCAETHSHLLKLESAWHKATYHSVTKLGSKTFSVIHMGKTGGLTLDWMMGFALYDTEAKQYVWKYKFSQLKGSSDDGKSLLTLIFQDPETSTCETKELECQQMTFLLYCMNAFLTAKIASVDPAFLRST